MSREDIVAAIDSLEKAGTSEEARTATVSEGTKVGETKVGEAKVEEPKVGEAKVGEAKVGEVKVEEPKNKIPEPQFGDKTKVEETKVEESKPKVEEPKVKVRPPESWKPAIREAHWSKLPPEVQAEIHRRERQIDTTLQQTAEARRTHDAVASLVTNYRDVFEAEKLPPFQSLTNLLQISRALRFGQPAHKAQVIAQAVKGFGIDVKLLDQALSMMLDPSAQAQTDQNAMFEQVLSKHLAPVREFMTSVSQTRQQAAQEQQQTLQNEIAAFAADPANEFFETVRDTMADIMEAGAARGQKITLQDAYQRAILAHNDLAPVVTQRAMAKAASEVSAPAARARQLASTSVTGAPSSGNVAPDVSTVRSALEAAVSKHSGRA